MQCHFQRVSDKLHVMQTKILHQYDCAKQCMPFGVGASSRPQVVEELRLTTNHDSCFHRARVGATATIEKYLEPAPHARHCVAPTKELRNLRRPASVGALPLLDRMPYLNLGQLNEWRLLDNTCDRANDGFVSEGGYEDRAAVNRRSSTPNGALRISVVALGVHSRLTTSRNQLSTQTG